MSDSTPLYSVGIDLGTTHCVVAYTALNEESPKVELLPIPQITAPNQSESLPFLPSFLYVPNDREKAEGIFSAFGDYCVGTYARQIAAEQPERTIAAAKSWLCQANIDRQSPILPWQAPEEVHQLSPVQTSSEYLKHLIQAWRSRFPEAPIEQQLVTLTVPASFDLVARELTLQAAREAGLPNNLILLEEPQAAIYHWIHSAGDDWRSQLTLGDQILVCDCGGGTTDLTLLATDQADGELSLRRVAVGQHLLVGGDNMDLTLAHHAAQRFAEQGAKLNAWQTVSLWHACRNAKEKLLSNDGLKTYPVSILGRGSRLIGGTISIELLQSEIESLLVDGFFPTCSFEERPLSQSDIGLHELGLQYESDTAVTRHVAAFLQDHATGPMSAGSSPTSASSPFPSHLLFNGGVFKSAAFRRRLMEVLQSWMPDQLPPKLLGELELDSAVASGAAYYGWSKTKKSVRIRGGIPSSFYVGIETTGPAVPGMPRPLQALCVAPKGMEEGTEADIPNRQFGLVIGKPAKFRFFSSHRRPQDHVGTLLRHWDEEELIESNALEVTLESEWRHEENQTTPEEKIEVGKTDAARPTPVGPVPVRFQSKVTELGMFELWCVSLRDDQRWKLSFNIRPKLPPPHT
jgi:hypothetical protein